MRKWTMGSKKKVKSLLHERERHRNCRKKLKNEEQTTKTDFLSIFALNIPNDKNSSQKSLAPSQVWPRTALQAVSECPLRR